MTIVKRKKAITSGSSLGWGFVPIGWGIINRTDVLIDTKATRVSARNRAKRLNDLAKNGQHYRVVRLFASNP